MQTSFITKVSKVSGHSKYRHSTKFLFPPDLPRTWNPFPSIPASKRRLWTISAKNQNGGTGRKFILELLWGCYKHVKRLWRGKNSISRPFIECIIIRLELAAKFAENILPIVLECKGELTAVAGNLTVLFQSWCRKLIELGLTDTPNYTHLVVYLLGPPERTVNGGLGRPKNEIDEETVWDRQQWFLGEHIDGHHSLLTWGFVIHGCIDGYSRLICFWSILQTTEKRPLKVFFCRVVAL